MTNRMIEWIEMIEDADPMRIGGKGAGLARVARTGHRVPPGFVIPADAFDEMLERASIDLGDSIIERPVEYSVLRSLSGRCRRAVRRAGLPAALADEVRIALSRLSTGAAEVGEPSFVVRSSATDEDTSGHSFAGIHESFTDLVTEQQVLDAIVGCWASAFGQRALAYRSMRRIAGAPRMAVIVQLMVDSERAGVMFSRDPGHPSDDVVVEAVYGHGETLVSGEVEPDTYTLTRPEDAASRPTVRSVHIGTKAVAVSRGEGGAEVRKQTAAADVARRVLDDAEAIALARIAIDLERRLGKPQDIEWAIDDKGRAWIVQSRPITTMAAAPVPHVDELDQPRSIVGLAAAPGLASGRVRIVTNANDAAAISPGEVLVSTMTTPDWITGIRRSAAVVTDGGGVTSHAAIIGRELGIPTVVATHVATTSLRNGQFVTVDGARGLVLLDGSVGEESISSGPEDAPPVVDGLTTRVFVNVATVERARIAAGQPGVDGVGLLRAEFLLTDALDGDHPRTLIEEGRSEEFVTRLAESVEAIAKEFSPRPVVYRAADFRSNEFRALRGGDRFEPVEDNPMIGYRGCFRYLREPEQFMLELRALARVAGHHKNLVLMLPFVRTRWELEACLAIVARSEFAAMEVPIWVMAEVPSILYRLTDYRALGIEGVSIGTNDLTQLMLGVDRDSELCAELFDERDDAVMGAVLDIIDRAHRVGLTVSLCGQAPSNHPEIVRGLVAAGIDSVSVDPSAVEAVRRELANAERELGRPTPIVPPRIR